MANNIQIILAMTFVIAFGLMSMVLFTVGNLGEGFILLVITIAIVSLVKTGKGFAYTYELESSAPLLVNISHSDKSGNMYLDDGSILTIEELKEDFEPIGIEFTEDPYADIIINTYVKKFISGPISIKDQKEYKIIINIKYFPYDNQEVLK